MHDEVASSLKHATGPLRPAQATQTQFFTFARQEEDRFHLENGSSFGPITLAYETYGQLNEARDNAILVFHALTGSQHASGHNAAVEGVGPLWTDEMQLGWWDDFIGPNRALDTNDFFIICANYLGGCYGSTGPMSVNPDTGRPYGGDFPVVTLEDVVNSQVRLLDHLGIQTLLGTIGGSVGGMMAVDLAVRYPDRVRCVIPMASGTRASSLQKLHNFEQIFAIEEDPNYRYGNYYDAEPPLMGLTLARMIGQKTFVSLDVLEERAHSEIRQSASDLKGYRLQHEIESYMLYQGKKFVKRFDANSYLRSLNLWQRYDLAARTGGDLAAALQPCRKHRYLVFSIDSDVCYYPDEQSEFCSVLKTLDINYQHITVHSEKGHDSFLLESDLYAPYISFVLHETHAKSGAAKS